MTNVVSLTTKEPITVETIDQHLTNVAQELEKYPGVSKAFTVLIDEVAGTWQLHRICCNTTNGDLFMAMALIKSRLISEVHDV